MAINDITTAIKFLKKTYAFRDAKALSKVDDQTVSGILNFQNGIQLFGIDVQVEPDSDGYIINFGNSSGEQTDLTEGYKNMLREILTAKDIEFSDKDDLYALIDKVHQLVNPKIYHSERGNYKVKEKQSLNLNVSVIKIKEVKNE